MGRLAQIFVYIAPNGSPEGDALFIHTPNPHGSFPHKFEDVEWGVPTTNGLNPDAAATPTDTAAAHFRCTHRPTDIGHPSHGPSFKNPSVDPTRYPSAIDIGDLSRGLSR